MTLKTSSLALGLLAGLWTATAQAQFSTSTLNRDGSRTLCGAYGCTTIPASSIYNSRSTSVDRYWDRYATGYGRYDSSLMPGGCYNNNSSTRSNAGYDPYWRNSSTLPRYRSTYNTYRETYRDGSYRDGYHRGYNDPYLNNSRYDSYYDRLTPSHHRHSTNWSDWRY